MQRGSVRIVGPLWRTTPGSAGWVADVLEGFDEAVHSWGLRTPPFTKILLVDRPLIPGVGTSTARFPLADVFKREAGHVIALDPYFYDVFSALEPSSIRRERARSALLATFSQTAPVNANGILRASLADFLAAHFSDSPRVGFMAGSVHHDIATMWSRYMGGLELAETGPTLSPYTNSLALSNLLWRIREKIGVGAMSSLLFDLLGNLNAHGGPGFHLLPRSRTAAAYEYMAAVVLKTARDDGHGREALEAVEESVRTLPFLDPGAIAARSEGFVGGGDRMLRERTGLGEMASGYGMALVFLAAEVYFLASFIF